MCDFHAKTKTENSFVLIERTPPVTETIIRMSTLHIITPLFNPLRFKSRYNLYNQFEQMVLQQPDVILTTVEVAFGDRPFHVTTKNNLRHVQLRTYDEIWTKESSINLGLQHTLQIYPEAEYFAWIDADVFFMNPNWVKETIEQLQHFMFVQMFSHAVDFGPNMEFIQKQNGFVYSYHQNGMVVPPQDFSYGGVISQYGFWHPGYAWAARREALDMVGGLIDYAILGAGDHHMSLAMVGEVQRSFPTGISQGYANQLRVWQSRCERKIKRDIGFVNGTLGHNFHGKKKDRRYSERWKILTDNNYDPNTDILRDSQGLITLDRQDFRLRDEMRLYFRARNEDSVDLE